MHESQSPAARTTRTSPFSQQERNPLETLRRASRGVDAAFHTTIQAMLAQCWAALLTAAPSIRRRLSSTQTWQKSPKKITFSSSSSRKTTVIRSVGVELIQRSLSISAPTLVSTITLSSVRRSRLVITPPTGNSSWTMHRRTPNMKDWRTISIS